MKADPLITYRRTPARLDRKLLEDFAVSLRDRLAKGREFHCLISGDAELRALNSAYRHKDYATDVLSFPGEGAYLGDIAISLVRARAQARIYRHSAEDEIRILMLHGVLHLKGMDHESDSGRMARSERAWRKKLGLPNGLIERAA
ncbi:MAG TPA: rRNA maturation RNase YbeY [Bryobacteraceae bacterium]|nr:rRNA maturation RNase YbeY [Bryobacteraceae bacterium]